jgi:hypothetical protein
MICYYHIDNLLSLSSRNRKNTSESERQNDTNQPSAKPSRKEFDLHEYNPLDNTPEGTESGKMPNMLLRKGKPQFFNCNYTTG